MDCDKCKPSQINLLFCFSFTESRLCEAYEESLISETYLYIQTLLSFDFIHNICVCVCVRVYKYMDMGMAIYLAINLIALQKQYWLITVFRAHLGQWK